MTGVIYYGSSGWYVDLTFTGLDPAKTYTFATSASRNGSTYTLRNTRYTISSVAATNASTAGVNVINESSVWFNTGDNHNEGYVARWTDIQPESDGSFTVRAEANDPATEYRAYAFDVFMLQEEGGIPPVMVDVPDVSGMTQADAESEIIAAGLTVGTVTTAYSSTSYCRPCNQPGSCCSHIGPRRFVSGSGSILRPCAAGSGCVRGF